MHRPLLIILILIFVSISAAGGTASPAASLANLDAMLKQDFISKRESRIDSLKKIPASLGELWKYHYEIAGAYTDFNVDSALYHLQLAEKLTDDADARRHILLRRGSIYNGALMLQKEASDIFNSLHSDPKDPEFSKDYYTFGVQLYKNLEEKAPDFALQREYTALKKAYRDSVLELSPDAMLIKANKLLDNGDFNATLSLLLPEIEGESFSPVNGAVYHIIAKAYGMQGNSAKQKEYLTLAAEADVVNGVREYEALPQLAHILYDEGDVDRAYRYMQRSIDDALDCSARVRLLNMSEAMSVISGAYAARQQTTEIWLFSLAVLLALAVIVAFILLHQSRKRNRLLHQSRAQLEEANAKLKAAGSIREKYGKRFMRLSLEFMDSLSHYRLYLLKVASKRKFDDLYDAISSTSAVERESETFYQNFDSAFLELYPDFIDEFNSLLRPEERIAMGDKKSLNTELRIFALMKLGIGESAEIAKLLHCSQSTVYNYRTKFRAKAIDKDEFIRKTFPGSPAEPPTK